MFASAAIAGICLIMLVIFWKNRLSMKAQAWFCLGIGLGAAGMAGNLLTQVSTAISEGIAAATSTVLGASIPWLLAIFTSVWFGIAVSKKGNDPDKLTLLIALFVPVTIVMLPGQVGTAADNTMTALGNSLTNLVNMAL